jgi:hypothetical protein
MSSQSLQSRVLSLAAENDVEGGWDLPSRQPSQLLEIINSGEINEHVGQDEVTEGQKQLRDGQEIEMSNTDAEACSETDKLPNRSNDVLNMIWKTMQKVQIEQERIRQETEESKKRLEEKIKQKVKEIERRIRKDWNK